MKYYKVKPEYGGKTAYGFHRGGGLRVVGQYVAGELYTATELKRRGDCLYMPYMDIVDIPKNKTFFNFGVRFEMSGDYGNIGGSGQSRSKIQRRCAGN